MLAELLSIRFKKIKYATSRELEVFVPMIGELFSNDIMAFDDDWIYESVFVPMCGELFSITR